MKRLSTALAATLAAVLTAGAAPSAAADLTTPLLVVGAGASGTAASVAAARLGTQVTVVEEHPWVGGMLTSAGVSAIDGNKNLPAGIWGEFRDSLVANYGSREALRTGWVSDVQFEPHVGQRILRNIIDNEPNVNLIQGYRPQAATKTDGGWKVTFAAADGSGDTFNVDARMVIDATELGDIAAMAGVPYDIGMESQAVTGEDVAPRQANSIIQDLTYVAVLKDYHRDMTSEAPEGYDYTEFACAAWNPLCVTPKEPHRMSNPREMITYGGLPGEKYMVNWPIEGNDFYVNIIELTPEQRAKALEAAKDFTLKFVHFIQTGLGMNTLALADDEFPTADRLPLIPYHRESRRIHGLVRFTVNEMNDPYVNNLYRTSIAVGDYPVDQHHMRYTGTDSLPDLHFHPVPSYSVPLGVLIPQDTPGLIVAEKSISVSNIANGATRLQPVVLQIGQAAGILAALALEQNAQPADVAVRDVQNALLAQRGYMMPYLDATPAEPYFEPIQRIGATGLLRGESRRAGWINETILHAGEPLSGADLQPLAELYGFELDKHMAQADTLYRSDLESVILKAAANTPGFSAAGAYPRAYEALAKAGLQMPGITEPVTRAVYAVVVDALLDPFNRFAIDIKGNIKNN